MKDFLFQRGMIEERIFGGAARLVASHSHSPYDLSHKHGILTFGGGWCYRARLTLTASEEGKREWRRILNLVD